ncbi:MAG: Rrf2 family transcriptional regulator [Treponemataceae bacterium]
MKLSTRTQYGLRMLCQLAIEHDKGSIQMGEIGDREGISEKYLGQIMLILKSSGLVLSVRGAQGGYYLSRSPDRIGLLEIFEILEGEIFDFGEETAPDASAVSKENRKDTLSATNEIWVRIRESIKEVLDKYTLDDVVRLGLFRTGYLDYRI